MCISIYSLQPCKGHHRRVKPSCVLHAPPTTVCGDGRREAEEAVQWSSTHLCTFSSLELTIQCTCQWQGPSQFGAGAKLMEKQRSKISEVHQMPSTTCNFFSQCNEFLATCKRLSVDPLKLLHILVWPLPFNKDTTCFDDGFLATLLGDAAGLCTILRDHTAGVDRVDTHPRAVEQLAVKISNIDDNCVPSFLLNNARCWPRTFRNCQHPLVIPSVGSCLRR